MVMQSVADDGVQVIIPGWTNQSLTPYTVGLDSYGGGTLGLAETPTGNNYLAWTMITEDAIATNAHNTTYGYLARFVAATGGSCGHLDIVTVSATYTNCVFGLYSGASFATGPLVWTADYHSSFGTANSLVAMTWNGASSPATVNLQAGSTYWIYMELTGTTPQIAGCTAANAAVLNANLTASATYANNAMQLTSGAPTSLTASTTLAPQTSWANSAVKPWFGLRA